MSNKQSLFQTLKKKSVKINLGERTYRMHLLTLALFGLAVLILLIAIIVLIIWTACSSKGEENVKLQGTESAELVEHIDQSGEEEIEPEDPVGIPLDEPILDEPIAQENEPEPTEEPTETPSPSPAEGAFSGTLKKGDVSDTVKDVQQRLVDLYYMDYPIHENNSYSVTNKYGDATSAAVQLFQERNGLPATGECDAATYEKLMSPDANPYIMKKNDRCNMVKVIQTKLKEKGYLDAKATGTCGDATITAVTNFQKANGITPDGIAGPDTLKMLLGH